MNFIGIDIGITSIKIIETNKELNIINKGIYERNDPQTILKKFVEENKIDLNSIKQIVATGIGANEINGFNNIEIVRVPEFIAIAKSGKTVLQDDNYLTISIGTGTAFVKNKDGQIEHIGGTGIGGGSVINLCNKIIPNISFEEINVITQTSKLEDIDLHIKDVTSEEIKTLPKDITAVNLGKLNKDTTYQDLVLGIINMTFETIGVMATFAAKSEGICKVIVCGQLVKLPFAKEVFNKIKLLHNIDFLIPQNPEFAVALGGIISCFDEIK